MQTIDRLNAFVGEWSVAADFPNVPQMDLTGRSTFEWALDRSFLVQRATIPHPEAPDSLCIYSADPYLQHYYDSRGVIRVYEMTLDDHGRWTLQRRKPDFTPLSFHQRWTATFEEGGSVIRGTWETSEDGERWEHDFELTYTKVA